MKKQIHIFCPLIALTFLSGCSSTNFGNDQTYQFGAATDANIAKQAVEPDPALKENTFIPADRDRVFAARKAYKDGNVKKLEPSQAQFD